MVLLHLILRWQRRWDLTPGIAHFNHQLRGKESDADEAFVSAVAGEFRLPFYSGSADISAATKKGESLEAVARAHREKFLMKCVEDNGYDSVVTAHHCDDQAETLLMRIIRGTGPNGLAGIRLRREKFVRPLLFATKEQIREYAAINNIAYREDSSNRQQNHLRNRVRHSLMPVLRDEFAVKSPEPFFRLAMLMQDWEDKNASDLKRALKSIRKNESENKIHLDIGAFRQYFSGIQQSCLQVIVTLLLNKNHRVKFQQLFSFNRWLKRCENGSTFLLFNQVAVCQKGKDLIFSLQTQPPDTTFFIELWPGDEMTIPAIGLQLSLLELPAADIDYDQTSARQYIDADHLTYPLNLRRWQSGDRFRPLGLKGSKTVSNYLTDRKRAQKNRQKLCVILEKKQIVMLPGEQIDDKYKLTPETRVALQVEARWDDDTGNAED